MKKSILFVGYGISPDRKEAVSINTLLLSKRMNDLGYSTHILNIGFNGYGSSIGSSMSNTLLHVPSIQNKIKSFIQENKITHIIDVFVLPLASILFVAPLKNALPNITYIKEIHNENGSSNKFHIETLIRLVANNEIAFNYLLKRFDVYFSRNMYLARKYSFIYLPMLIDKHPVKVRTKRKRIHISYLGHPLAKKGIFEFPKLFSLLPNDIKQKCSFNFALSNIGNREYVEKVLLQAAAANDVQINLFHEVKPWQFFRKQDFYILPIHDQFGAVSTPNTVLEAMEAGAIPIVHDIPSLKGIVENNKTGILLENFEAKYIVDVIKAVVYDSTLQKKLRLAARSFIHSNFVENNIKTTIRKILA